jgi:peptide/nickel transport system permease protein
MLWSVGRRVLRSALVVLLVTFFVVSLLELAPGSIGQVVLGNTATPEAVATLNHKLGVDQPLLEQYWHWLTHALQGNLGTSPFTGQKVTDTVLKAIPVTVELAILAELIALVIAIPLALAAASRPNSIVDRGINALSSIFLSIPAFVAAPILLYFFAVKIHVFPVLGWKPITDGLGSNLQAALLPAIAIALPEIAAYQRLLRTDLAATLSEDYISAARAKGMSGRYVLLRHALRPSSFSLVTLAGIGLGRLLGGTVIVESLFSLPGLGNMIASAITSRDVTQVQGAVAFIAVSYVVINMLVDASYSLLDPRVRKVAAA